MTTGAALDFDQDMQTIRDYVDAVVQAQAQVAAFILRHSIAFNLPYKPHRPPGPAQTSLA